MKILRNVSVILLTVSLFFGVSSTALAASAVSLGAANNFAVLAGSAITNTGSSVISGNLGLSPGSAVAGFPPGLVSGSQNVANALAVTAQTDLVTAYNALGAQSGTNTIAGDLGGQTLTPGVYTSMSSIGLTGSLTLDGGGNQNAVFIFQAGSTLTTASNSSVNLINGAQACNVYWQIGSSATLGTNSSFVGNILAMTSITLTTGTSVNGRILARNGAVTLDNNNISITSCAPVVVPPVVVPPVVVVPVVNPTSTSTPVVTLVQPLPQASSTPVIYSLPYTGVDPSSSNLSWQLIVLVVSSLLLIAISNRKIGSWNIK